MTVNQKPNEKNTHNPVRIGTHPVASANFNPKIAVKHPQNVVFPGEELMVTVQDKVNGKMVNILADAVMVNGVNNGNSHFGTITGTGTGAYKYKAPATMPSAPVVAIAAVVKNAKGLKPPEGAANIATVPKGAAKTLAQCDNTIARRDPAKTSEQAGISYSLFKLLTGLVSAACTAL